MLMLPGREARWVISLASSIGVESGDRIVLFRGCSNSMCVDPKGKACLCDQAYELGLWLRFSTMFPLWCHLWWTRFTGAQ